MPTNAMDLVNLMVVSNRLFYSTEWSGKARPAKFRDSGVRLPISWPRQGTNENRKIQGCFGNQCKAVIDE